MRLYKVILGVMIITTSLSAWAEEYLYYDKNPKTALVLHIHPCNAKVVNTSNQGSMQATVFSKATNKAIGQGCWRFAEKSLVILVQMEDGQKIQLLPDDVTKEERF